MRAEVIMAVRNEYQDRVDRTLASLRGTLGKDAGICIVYDGVQEGEREIRGARCIRPYDAPRGCGQARHHGITTSEADIVVLVDAHMQFPRGWIDEVCAHLGQRKHWRHLCCAHMQSLDHDWRPVGTPYAGAWLAYKCRDVGNQWWPIAAKWNNNDPGSGPIPAVMGACYAMRRAHYERIGRPLQLLEAWGMDEELLSIATHVSGGKVRLLPFAVGHEYGAPKRPGPTASPIHVWANRLATLHALPMTEGLRADLIAWQARNGLDHRAIARSYGARAGLAEQIHTHLCRQGERIVDNLIEDGVIRAMTPAEQAAALVSDKADVDRTRTMTTQTTPCPTQAVARIVPAAPDDDRPQIVIRKREVCERCNAVDSFRAIRGAETFAAFEMTYSRCARCGHKAQIRRV